MKNKTSFAFISMLAIICNAFYLFTTAFLFLSWLKIPKEVANFMAVLGLEMAPFVNLVFVIWFIINLLRKKQMDLPKWQTIINLLMLLLQITLLII
jgi:membrane protein DedA with SNARE-associated domain